MNIEAFRAHCLGKPGVTETLPGEGRLIWMKVAGKMFAMVNIEAMTKDGEQVPPFFFMNLKNDPERNQELREQHADIEPGWHQNKKHWNTIYLNGSVRDSLLLQLVDESYALVRQGLPKKIQQELEA